MEAAQADGMTSGRLLAHSSHRGLEIGVRGWLDFQCCSRIMVGGYVVAGRGSHRPCAVAWDREVLRAGTPHRN